MDLKFLIGAGVAAAGLVGTAIVAAVAGTKNDDSQNQSDNEEQNNSSDNIKAHSQTDEEMDLAWRASNS